ncbi:MAG TPA: type III pantothenate kinase [Alphaproteobacteria bacterium]|nr:type III pantothenate kinase [Rhodospirillaceae bacterium]HRJ12605.1 type III pantothenate kinase [Alphaproteobacteria bacterium]
MPWFKKKHTLVIDAGNTNVVFAVTDAGQIIHEYRHETNLRTTADDLAVWFLSLLQLEKKDFTAIDAVVIASVAPALDYALRAFVRKYLKLEPVFIFSGINLPFELKLPNPNQAGADRICNAAGVRAHYSYPTIVIDLGTATTFDVIDAGGDYVGGVIAPGPQASLQALIEATSKLPHIHIIRPERVLGSDTISAMQSGLFWGYVGLIEGILRQLQAELGEMKSIIATGGLAKLFQDHIPGLTAVDMDITIKGALSLYENQKGK